MEQQYLGRRYPGAAPCFAFAADWLKDHGLDLPGYDYPRAQHSEALRRHLAEHADPVDSPSPGDVILLSRGGQPAHIGVMVTDTEFLHHDERHGVIRESIRSVHWRNRVAGYHRPRLPESPP